MAQTKAQLDVLVREYRADNADLRRRLEEHGTPRNVCDDISDFFGTCTKYVEEAYDTSTKSLNEAYESSKNFVFGS